VFPNVYKHRYLFNYIITNMMNMSAQQNRNQQRFELQMRRLRLISDIMEDYQENIRNAFRLINYELGLSNNTYATQRPTHNLFWNQRTTANPNVDDWLDRISQVTMDMFPGSETAARDGMAFTTRPNIRRGYIYTQLFNPRNDEQTDTGISNEQIANCTQVVKYDASMNETRCPITWEQFELNQNVIQIKNCRHIFGHQALMEWFQNHSRCPVCRASVLQETPTTSASTTSASASATSASASASSSPPASVSSSRSYPLRATTATGTSTSTNALSQLVSGILNGVNGASSADNGYYESEITFNVNDIMDLYSQLLGNQSAASRSSSSSHTNTNTDI